MSATITKGVSFEDQGATLMARVVGNDAAAITQATISTITYTVIDRRDPSTKIVDASSLTVSAVVFDTLQTDDRWSTDETGYNFRHTVPASVLSGGEKRYRIEYKFTPSSGEVFFCVFEITTEAIYTS